MGTPEPTPARIDKLLVRILWSLGAFFLILAALGVWSLILQGETAELGRENRNRIAEIHSSRTNSIVASCEEANARNTKLKEVLGTGAGRIAKEVRAKRTPQQQREADMQGPLVNLFVEAIAIQHPDCAAYARERTSRSGGKR